jgi:hypothetical protein
VDASAVWSIAIGVGGLFLAVVTGIAHAISGAARRPVQRAADAAALLANLDQVAQSEQDLVGTEGRKDVELRRELAAIVRGNAGRYVAAPMHEPGDDTWRMILTVEFIFFLAVGIFFLVSDPPGSVPAGVFFLVVAGITGTGAAQSHVVYRRRKRAHELAGLTPPPSWLGMYAELGLEAKLAVRRWRSHRSDL